MNCVVETYNIDVRTHIPKVHAFPMIREYCDRTPLEKDRREPLEPTPGEPPYGLKPPH